MPEPPPVIKVVVLSDILSPFEDASGHAAVARAPRITRPSAAGDALGRVLGATAPTTAAVGPFASSGRMVLCAIHLCAPSAVQRMPTETYFLTYRTDRKQHLPVRKRPQWDHLEIDETRLHEGKLSEVLLGLVHARALEKDRRPRLE